MASEVLIARENNVSPMRIKNGMSSRTRAYGGSREQAVNRRAESLAVRYARWNDPLRASDWEINNADRISRAAARMIRR